MAKLPKYLNANEYNTIDACNMIAKAVLADPNYADMLGYTLFAKEVLKMDNPFDLSILKKKKMEHLSLVLLFMMLLANTHRDSRESKDKRRRRR